MHHGCLEAVVIHSRFVSLPIMNACAELVHGTAFLRTDRVSTNLVTFGGGELRTQPTHTSFRALKRVNFLGLTR